MSNITQKVVKKIIKLCKIKDTVFDNKNRLHWWNGGGTNQDMNPGTVVRLIGFRPFMVAVDMNIHGYIHEYIHMWTSDLRHTMVISVDRWFTSGTRKTTESGRNFRDFCQ